MNICIFSRPFYPAVGGLESVAHMLAVEAVGLGHKVEVVTDTIGVSALDDQGFPFLITRAKRFRERVAAFRRADVVLFMNVSLIGLIAAVAARRPVVFSHHGVYLGRGVFGKVFELIKRQLTWLYPNISVSRYVSEEIPSSSVVIPNAYNCEIFKQPVRAMRECDFVFCGRLVSDKGADICLRAFSNVFKKDPETTLTIVGDGPDREALVLLSEQLGIQKGLRFTGTLTGHDLVSELQRHACMVIPSLCEEAFGIVALEGIACCDTVIASNRGGLPEAAGNCGILVDPSIGELSSAMESIAAARRAGDPLPGQPSSHVREAHLGLHTPKQMAEGYLRVLMKAAKQ